MQMFSSNENRNILIKKEFCKKYSDMGFNVLSQHIFRLITAKAKSLMHKSLQVKWSLKSKASMYRHMSSLKVRRVKHIKTILKYQIEKLTPG